MYRGLLTGESAMTDEADRIRNAVLDYVAAHPGALDQDRVEAIRTADASRNDAGNLRLGSWLLVNRGGEHVLIRPSAAGPSHLTAIYLEKTDAGGWRVTDVGEEHYRFS